MRQRRHFKPETENQRKGAERRTAPRLPPSAIDGLRAAKLVAGPEVRLVNISRGGALLETRARLLIGSKVSVKLTTKDGLFTLRGGVLRSRVTVLEAGMILYESAVVFDEEFTQLAEGTLSAEAFRSEAEISAEDLAADRGGLIDDSIFQPGPTLAAGRGNITAFPGADKRTASQG